MREIASPEVTSAGAELAMRRKEPWFKLWANDYLTDPDVDELPLEAQGLLLRMWCVCSQRGNIPDDAEEIARLTRCKLQDVSQCYSQCKRFFKLQDGLLRSERMEAEKAKSETARANAQRRYSKKTHPAENANGNANGIASPTAQKVREQESKSTEGERAGDARVARSAPPHSVPSTVELPPVSDEAMRAARRFFKEMKATASPSRLNIAAQAHDFEARRLGSMEQAEARILKAAKAAQQRGDVKNWAFWFEDDGWKALSPEERQRARDEAQQRRDDEQRRETFAIFDAWLNEPGKVQKLVPDVRSNVRAWWREQPAEYRERVPWPEETPVPPASPPEPHAHIQPQAERQAAISHSPLSDPQLKRADELAQVLPPGMIPMEYAKSVLQEASLPDTLLGAATKAIERLGDQEGCPLHEAARRMLRKVLAATRRAAAQKEQVPWLLWFQGDRWK